jgi:hypothetical protein
VVSTQTECRQPLAGEIRLVTADPPPVGTEMVSALDK